ncbi:MAG: cytochrome c oxidase subunit I [Gemmatimonadetes bacterium]|nr:cytochrome c oxidase subunit I [Gemmatimonadota bacterium]
MAITKARAATVTAGPHARGGIWSWITTVDHKRIGILYGTSALVFFLVGGLEALLIRAQLARPENGFVGPETYNQLFTMHGTTMVFLVAMPAAVAFFNYIVPLQIGARDVAFPRLNALSYWVFLFGGLFMNSSFLLGQAPNGGWTGYVPLTGPRFAPGLHIDFWVLGLSMLGISSILGGVNFITTIINLRAPGMRLMRMPLFTWMTLVTSFLLVTAMPVIAVALILLIFDRFFGTSFYAPAGGGDPVLWQHLFWMFGHPEVYILILPAFGMVSEVIPTFSRKPLFGYAIMVYSGILIGFIGWGVWSHHMFATGLGPIADAFFAIATMIIAIPTGVKIFNWLATMWGGSLRFSTAMLFAIGVIASFTIGGISGIMHSAAPADLQQHDTYFVVAHFHYTIFGGTILGTFAGIYYWFPKMTGRLLDERLGKWHFWLMFLGFHLTFFPMHWIGLLGMPRRIFTYYDELGLGSLNLLATIGAFTQGVAVVLFLWNLLRSRRHGVVVGPNPWNAATLEWSIPSPPPEYNFAVIPEVHSREPLWERREATPAPPAPEPAIHLPPPSHWPIVVAFGVLLTFGLFLANVWWVPLGGVALVAFGVMNWAFEPGH